MQARRGNGHNTSEHNISFICLEAVSFWLTNLQAIKQLKNKSGTQRRPLIFGNNLDPHQGSNLINCLVHVTGFLSGFHTTSIPSWPSALVFLKEPARWLLTYNLLWSLRWTTRSLRIKNPPSYSRIDPNSSVLQVQPTWPTRGQWHKFRWTDTGQLQSR